LNTVLTPHSIIHGDACFAYFNKIWGIPITLCSFDILSDHSQWQKYMRKYRLGVGLLAAGFALQLIAALVAWSSMNGF
jgi:hypothetical protein